MPGVEEELALDITSALNAVDQVEAALTQSAQQFSVALADALSPLNNVTIPDVDASSVTASITAAVEAADTVVPVEVDERQLEDEIEQAVAAADTSITVTADTTQATAAVGELADAAAAVAAPAEEAGQALGDVGSAATIVNTSASLATGQMGQLRGVLGNVAKGAGVAGAALGGVALVGFQLFDAAVEADTATRRFEGTLGEFAETVNRIDVGGLDESIESLATRLGSSDEAVSDAAASLFQLGESSGKAGRQVAATTEQVLALAARAVALDPALGDVGTVADRLATALARGERAAVPFGISLDAADVEARALRDNIGKTAETLTVYERIAAGAVIVTERLGTSIGDDINRGAQAAEFRLGALQERIGNTFEALGADLVDPVIELFESLEPAITSVATAGGQLAEGVVPVLTVGFKALGTVAELLADTLGLIPEEAVTIAASLYAINRVTGPLTTGLTQARTAVAALNATSLQAGTTSLGGGLKSMVGQINPLAVVVAGAGAAFIAWRRTMQGIDREVEGLTDAIKADSGAIGENTRAVVVNKLEKEGLLEAATKLGIPLEQVTAAALGNATALDAVNTALDQVAGTTRSYGEALDAGNTEQTEAVEAAVALRGALGDITKETIEGKTSYDRITAATGAATTATGVWTEAQLAARQALLDLTDAARAGLPEVGDLWGQVAEDTKTAAADYIATVKQQAIDTQNFALNIRTLISRGAVDLAESLIKEGLTPVTAQAAAQFAKMPPELLRQQEIALDQSRRTIQEFEDLQAHDQQVLEERRRRHEEENKRITAEASTERQRIWSAEWSAIQNTTTVQGAKLESQLRAQGEAAGTAFTNGFRYGISPAVDEFLRFERRTFVPPPVAPNIPVQPSAPTVLSPETTTDVSSNVRDRSLGADRTTINVYEVANDPEATAFAVNARLGESGIR